ncbi:MAG: Sapep family Mn(2+)-dependent dipeptidase [Negativicutes bacterium]|nr:Sapep family Mn(2+)-dependent dipeptidase [Negativicutes bacterium]
MELNKAIQEKVRAYQEDMIRDIFSLVAIDSVKTAAVEGKPFGAGPAAALAKSKEIAEALGFTAVNLDNYCTYAQMGEGEQKIGILAHVDIVPLGEGWTKNPLGGDRENGFIYGRGVSDNKGPCVMSLYAMKIVRELGIPIHKNVRVIMGANEESGMQCVKHYREVEGGFDYGFTPDAAFPVTFGEKGSYRANFSAGKLGKGEVKLLSVQGGTAANVVCPAVDALLDCGKQSETVAEKFKAYLSRNDLGGQVSHSAEGITTLRLVGKAAHASTPQLGVNSISHMMAFLAEVTEEIPFVQAYNACIGLGFNGEKCGVDLSDQYGRLTFNVGLISTQDDTVTASIDIRYPVTILDFAPHAAVIAEHLTASGAVLSGVRIGKPLFVDPNSDLVRVLSEVYVEVTGDTVNQPGTMGGGTYAKGFDHCVAFGAEFAGDDNRIHNTDECLQIEKMLKATEIIAHALIKLLSL